MSEYEENELIPVAMQMILHAGDARIKTQEALAFTKTFDFKFANDCMIEADECLHQAHIAQTDVIQNEARGQVYDSCLLFNHAQDTLMTIMSEQKLAKEMIEMFEILYRKIEEN